jgi:hypothetical protein
MIYLKAALYGLLSAALVAAVQFTSNALFLVLYSFSPSPDGLMSDVAWFWPPPAALAVVCSVMWTLKNGAAAFTRVGFVTLFKAVLSGAMAAQLAAVVNQYLLGLVLKGFESAQTSRDEVTEVFVSLAFFGLILSLAAYGVGFVWSLKRSRGQALAART